MFELSSVNQDAWLDSVDADISYTTKSTQPKYKEEEFKELSSKDIGQIKRRIANILGPGETVFLVNDSMKTVNFLTLLWNCIIVLMNCIH